MATDGILSHVKFWPSEKIFAARLNTLAGVDNGKIAMNAHKSFAEFVYEDETYVAERELSAFMGAVTELYGSEQANLAGKEWLDESDLMDSPPVSTGRNWRAVTIAASTRLVSRLRVRAG